MSAEAPQRIDLSQDLQTQGIKLSPQEQESFKKYLDTLKAEEKQSIIYLTHQELGELKKILNEQIARDTETQQNTALHPNQNLTFGNGQAPKTPDFAPMQDLSFGDIEHKKLRDFLEAQKTEGISPSDLLEGVDGFPENFTKQLEEKSRETLFGEKGMMKGQEISEAAKNSLTSSFSLALLEAIKQSGNTPEDIFGILEASDSKFQLIQEAFGDTTQKINIQENGEKNEIFMNLGKGKEFFKNLFEGKYASKEDIKTALELANIPEGSDVSGNTEEDIMALRASAKQDMSDIQKALESAPVIGGDVVPNTPISEASPEEKKSLIEKWKESGNIFLQILASILEFVKNPDAQGDTSSDSTSGDAGAGTNSPDAAGETSSETEEDSETQKDATLLSLFDKNAKTPIDTAFLEMLQKNPEALRKIRTTLEGISSKDTFETTFNDVFGKGENGKITNVQDVFQKYGFEKTIPEGTSPIDTVLLLLEEYSRYRNSDGVRGKETGRTSWEDWAKLRQSQNWSRVGK